MTNFKFKSLGFLAHLIADEETNFIENEGTEWMKFYTRNEDSFPRFKYEPLSINDIEDADGLLLTLQTKYFVFLDDFLAQATMPPSQPKGWSC